MYYGEEIDAGASAELVALSDTERSDFVELLIQHPLVPPQTSGNTGGFFDWNIDMSYMYGGATPVQYGSNLMERRLTLLQRLQSSAGALEHEPSTYAAVVRENPGIELGVDKSQPQVSLHVLIGYY